MLKLKIRNWQCEFRQAAAARARTPSTAPTADLIETGQTVGNLRDADGKRVGSCVHGCMVVFGRFS
jgi:hypothetical protein